MHRKYKTGGFLSQFYLFNFFLQHLLQWKIETVKLNQTLYTHTIYNIYIMYIFFFAQQVIISNLEQKCKWKESLV